MSFFRSPLRLLTMATGVVIAAVSAQTALAEEKPHPIVDVVKAAVKDPSKPFTLIVRFKTKEDANDKLEGAFTKAIKKTRKEKGCLVYQLSKNPKKPNEYLMYERWSSLATLEAHLKTPHITALLKEVGDLLADAPQLDVLVPASE